MEIVPNPRILWIREFLVPHFRFCGGNRPLLFPTEGLLSPISFLCPQIPNWAPNFRFGDQVSHLGTTFVRRGLHFAFCGRKFQIGRPISRLETKFRIWGQHSSGGDYILHFVAAYSKLGVRFPVWTLRFAFGRKYCPGGTEMLND